MSTPTSVHTSAPLMPEKNAAEQQAQSEKLAAAPNKISVRDMNFYYGKSQALHDISINVDERVVMAFIGPSGCGKSTFLRTLNRMNDTIPGTRVEGQIHVDGQDVYAPNMDVVD